MLIEGEHLVHEALAAGIRLETVLVTPDFLAGPGGRRLAGVLTEAPLEIEAALLEEIADADSPRGVVAVADLPPPELEALPRRAGGVYVYCAGLQDPGNLGALARVTEAAGGSGLVLAPGSVHPYHPRALRASAGSLLRIPAIPNVEPAALSHHLAPLPDPRCAAASSTPQPHWIALVAHGGEPWTGGDWAGSPGKTVVLALGAEGPGLDAELVAAAGATVTIPLAPPVESLNATVALALILFELRRRRSG